MTAAHRSSYPVGNSRHGTDESPNWGPFCVECVQSWPCEMSVTLEQLARAEAAYQRALRYWHEADPDHCGGECFREASIRAALREAIR